uniref:Uncharacterized protein n=1 Tax=Leersia perrieri TaxID=77586 RepID=A0A0D9V1L2_9ORYZ
MAPPLVSWSDGLPPEMLLIVLSHLHCLADRVCFGAVCRSWRSTTKQQAAKEAAAAAPQRPLLLPWLLSPSPVDEPTITSFVSGVARRINLPECLRCKGRFFGSFSGGWLAVALGMCGDYLLANFRSGQTIPLPSMMRYQETPSLTDEMSTTTPAILRAIVFSSAPDSPGCVAGALTCGTANIAFCQLDTCKVWTGGPEIVPGAAIDDMVFFQGSFHAISSYDVMTVFTMWSPADTPGGRVDAVSQHSFSMPMRFRPSDRSAPLIRGAARSASRYLVVSRNKLLMVVRYYFPATIDFDGCIAEFPRRWTVLFRVFQMKKLRNGGFFWDALNGLDGRVLFLGRCCSRAFEASEISGFNGGSIYFLDDVKFDLSLVMKDNADYPSQDAGMYAMPSDVVVRPSMDVAAAGMQSSGSIYKGKYHLLHQKFSGQNGNLFEFVSAALGGDGGGGHVSSGLGASASTASASQSASGENNKTGILGTVWNFNSAPFSRFSAPVWLEP